MHLMPAGLDSTPPPTPPNAHTRTHTHTRGLADRQYQLTVVQLFSRHKDGR